MKSFIVNYKIKQLILFVQLLVLSIATGQNLVNNGASIVVASGACLTVSGNYINLQGKIDLSGTLVVKGDWINNSSETVFDSLNLNGKVVLNGSTPQQITGSTTTAFPNLSLQGSEKTITQSNCTVSGILTLACILNLNTKKLILKNRFPSALTYLNGYIKSESLPNWGLSEIQWNIGNTSGLYLIPFGSGKASDDDLRVKLSTHASSFTSSDGIISFATYPTDCGYNPLPFNATPINTSDIIVNRYWIIAPNYLSEKPSVDISLTYTEADISNSCHESLIQEDLKAIRYNTTIFSWSDREPEGVASKYSKTVLANTISSNDFYSLWALVSHSTKPTLFFPSAFSPNGDGKNETFGPEGSNLDGYNFEMLIYNRWGEEIFKTTSLSDRWNGKIKATYSDAPQGGYLWVAKIENSSGDKFDYSGTVILFY